jgi:hypothetical protein
VIYEAESGGGMTPTKSFNAKRSAEIALMLTENDVLFDNDLDDALMALIERYPDLTLNEFFGGYLLIAPKENQTSAERVALIMSLVKL